ncbi:hypothetical protein O3S68_22190 [Kosakonia sp. SOY2]|uniref:hypothetical protein n=1 Tax=Kosakonia sp. SOY2 TaxID=3014557 RepID=UPI0022AC2908|nr:hypothetical protein [Kosakonia sp. SOY2]MCZ3384986.1 hypothetical protein [Kosakonia sp. SOY2]
MSQQFTNDQTPEMLAGMDKSPFTPEQLAEVNGEARALIEKQEAFCRAHLVKAIHRIAVAGCLTLRGGTGDEFNPNPEVGYKIRQENGHWVSVLTVGCTVTYPDGSSARIVSSAGSKHTCGGREIALVGSLLSNGDRIISTPQSAGMLIVRDGVPMGDDVLSAGHE